jgi:transposase
MSHRYRLYPAPRHQGGLQRHCADARFVWNLALEQHGFGRENRTGKWWDKPGLGPRPGPAARQRQLARARQGTWLAEGSSSVQQQALRDFDQALANWREKTHGRPRWRKKGEDEGFCVRDITVNQLNRRWATVRVPKVGAVRFRLSRPLPNAAGMARITLDASGRWHVSFAAVQPAVVRTTAGSAVGIDRGVVTTLALSDGTMLRAPSSPKLAAKTIRLDQRLARQRRGSKRRAKTKRERARTHARIADRRRDWVEKTTTTLVVGHDVLVLEDLRVKHMVRRPRPKPDPARQGAFLPNGAAAKAGLNRSIHRSNWSTFARRLQDKATASGCTVLLVDPRHTSQQCRRCGHTASENRESQAVFRCVSCGHANHADINAAENIVARGLAPAPTPGHGARPDHRPARVSPPRAAAGTSGEVAA